MLGYRSEMELFMHRVIRSKKCFSLKGLEREVILENHSFFRKRKMDLFPCCSNYSHRSSESRSITKDRLIDGLISEERFDGWINPYRGSYKLLPDLHKSKIPPIPPREGDPSPRRRCLISD